jgi:Ala-tRNA(Pro) deacylase
MRLEITGFDPFCLAPKTNYSRVTILLDTQIFYVAHRLIGYYYCNKVTIQVVEVHMPVRKLKEFLDNHSIKYVTITHSAAYTAQEVAGSVHIPGKELAKTVMVKLDNKMAMAVISAPAKVNLDQLRQISGAGLAELATEEEFKNMFPDCEPGAMPPFGNLYEMSVYVGEELSRDEEIAFNAGTHTELIRLAYKDFERLVKPKVAHFSTRD